MSPAPPPTWSLEPAAPNALRRVVKLANFAEAMALAQQLAELAEARDHHPELTVAWGQLAIRLWSHDAGGVTARDQAWAAAAEPIIARAMTASGATWDARYAVDDYVFGTAPNTGVQAHATMWRPGERVLCVADGEGRNGVYLASRGLVVDAFDPSAEGLAKAARLAAAQGVTVTRHLADVDSFAWPRGSCDGVVAVFVQFAGPALRDRMFRKIVDALAPGGRLLLIGYTPAQLTHGTGGPPFLDHLYEAPMLRAAFAELTIDHVTETEEVLDEGPGHRGTSALITLIAHKPA